MMGGAKATATPPSGGGGRPQAGDVAKISGTLTHVFVTGTGADALQAFVNDQAVLTGQIESISVEIVAPEEGTSGTLTAILSRYEGGADTARTTNAISLFPGTVEFVAQGKRLSITCAEEGSFDGLFLRFGTDNDGVGLEASGVKSLRLLVTPNLLDGRLVWVEDQREDIILG